MTAASAISSLSRRKSRHSFSAWANIFLVMPVSALFAIQSTK